MFNGWGSLFVKISIFIVSSIYFVNPVEAIHAGIISVYKSFLFGSILYFTSRCIVVYLIAIMLEISLPAMAIIGSMVAPVCVIGLLKKK